jgi:uncharacterized repeat protein (TIGR03803 family)
MSRRSSFLGTKWKSAIVLSLLCATVCLHSSAQVFTKLVDFSQNVDPEPDQTQLVQDWHGNLWATSDGFYGTAFVMSTSGELTTIYDFGIYGVAPNAGLLGSDGDFYGTTELGGANGLGNIYKLTPEGTYTDLHDFDFTAGQYPISQLLLGPDGFFYGTTVSGGSSTNCQQFGCGVIYKFNGTGQFSVLYNFDGTHGDAPFGGLIFASNGKFYGTTTSGNGRASYGTVFSLSPSGVFNVIHDFTNGSGGATPWGGVVEGPDGNFYGTAAAGGINNAGIVYKITPAGKFTNLHSFNFLVDGGSPLSGLALGTDKNFYGTSWANGNSPTCTPPCGTIYQITTAGAFTNLHSFIGSDGSGLQVPLTQHTNGKFYGAASYGGANQWGTGYSLDVGLGPFLRLQNPTGSAGSTVYILGTALTGTSAVTFNGVAAIFSVRSDAFITATVPAGATTGPVKATTPHGILQSNTDFRVR